MKNIKYLLSKLQENPNGKATDTLAEIGEKVKLIFLEIKRCNDLKDAKIYFDFLQEIQETLGFLFFNDIIQLSPELRQFVRDCDRLDDPWLRENLFQRLKNNTYLLKK